MPGYRGGGSRPGMGGGGGGATSFATLQMRGHPMLQQQALWDARRNLLKQQWSGNPYQQSLAQLELDRLMQGMGNQMGMMQHRARGIGPVGRGGQGRSGLASQMIPYMFGGAVGGGGGLGGPWF